jgi:hypothetical protein
MVPSKVDSNKKQAPNKKQARSSNDKDEEHLFLLIEWQTLFQVQVKLQYILQICHLEIYIMNVSMKEMHGNFQFQL